MLRIAIVDDEQQIREELCAMVSRFVDENGASLHVDCYAGGREFLESGATEDIVFLDIEMGEPDGMETARLMRRAGLASEIIFVTNMAQYAVEGYEVRALDFIVKPVRYQSFAFKLRRAIDVASRKKTARIELETREGLRRVSTSDIDYVEVVRHKLLYHPSRGVLEVWGTMREACERLEPFGNQNPKPVFCFSGARLEAADAVGNGRHLRVRLGVGRGHFEGIFFGHSAQELGIRPGECVDAAFTPQINDFRGHVSVQLVLCAMRPHDPLPLCREILGGGRDACWAAADYCPERSDFVRVWRRGGGELHVPQSAEEILRGCPVGMAPETYCLCLMTLLECGLLQSADGRIYGAASAVLDGKADLEATELMAALRGCRKSGERRPS